MVIVLAWGLSPYTRGIHAPCRGPHPPLGSIPVHTGNTYLRYVRPKCLGVYPRTHGEYAVDISPVKSSRGLSPYTRGIHAPSRGAHSSLGSIPVHTGNTRAPRGGRVDMRVYPRTHGEYDGSGISLSTAWGLSPYTRGILNIATDGTASWGSIPVHTGNTWS